MIATVLFFNKRLQPFHSPHYDEKANRTYSPNMDHRDINYHHIFLSTAQALAPVLIMIKRTHPNFDQTPTLLSYLQSKDTS